MAYGRFARYYDRLMDDMPYGDWLAFLEECWRRYRRPDTVVDLGCGTGSISIPLAEGGLRITGIDLSADMLAMARRKAAGVPTGRLTWLQQDMREWTVETEVDCVVSICDSLNYLTGDGDLDAAFNSTFQALRPGGLFVFDMNTIFRYETYAEEQPFILNEDDIAYIWCCDWDPELLTIRHDLTIFAREDEPGDRFLRVDEMHVQRGYSLDRVEALLRKAGFGRIDFYADFTWDPVDEDTERAFVVAVKEG